MNKSVQYRIVAVANLFFSWQGRAHSDANIYIFILLTMRGIRNKSK